MLSPITTTLLLFYGIFLILCGIVSVLLIGKKAKTALASGGISGAITMVLAYLTDVGVYAAAVGGIFLALGLTIVFSWRSAKTLFKIFELIPAKAPELKGKGIAFLIISLMAVMSLVVGLIQILLLF